MNPKTQLSHQRRLAWWASIALLLTAVAIALPLATRVAAGPPGARVHVRWQADLEQNEREILETQFRLTRRERLDDRTWRYDLVDTRTGNLRALIEHPAVADTHDIDRSRHAISPTAVRTARRQRFGGGGNGIVVIADIVAAVAAIAALTLSLIGAAGRAATAHAAAAFISGAARSARRMSTAVALPGVQFLQRGIPEIDANTAGIFRIVLGLLVVTYFATDPVDSSLLDAAFDVNVNGALHEAALEWLRGRPGLVDAVAPWLLVTGIAFTVGLFTRMSYALFVLGVLLWAYIAVYTDSTHPHSTLILALVALLPSRWGDGLSVDAWRRSATRPTYGTQYGYSVWVPCLVFGIAFAAAAWAKLSGGLTWVTNGAVKYHFVTDAAHAPVDWGSHLIEYPTLAVAASLVAVTVEALTITAAFTRTVHYRLLLGLGAVSLLAGFWVFMGVFWPGWWILLLGFLPWAWFQVRSVRLKADHASPAEAGHYVRTNATAAQLAMIVFVIAQQATISALKIERPPMFTYYPMYSASWPSVDAFNQSRPPVYRIRVSTDTGSRELRCSPSERLVTEFREAAGGSRAAAVRVQRQLRDCDSTVTAGQTVVFEEYRRTFDVATRELRMTPTAGTLGPVRLETEN